jgi:hypothetical protein
LTFAKLPKIHTSQQKIFQEEMEKKNCTKEKKLGKFSWGVCGGWGSWAHFLLNLMGIRCAFDDLIHYIVK